MVVVMNKQFETQLEREDISALMDGQLRADQVPAVLQGMDCSEARDCWRLYHLVGDVLRSPDLAAGAHDAGFMAGLRARLASEAAPAPVMVAEPVRVRDARAAANDGVFRWKMVAGLASFAAVAAIGWGVLGGLGPQPGGAQLAQSQGQPAAESTRVVALTPSLPAAPAAAPATAMADAEAVMVRDPRLDELLVAHRQAVGASALGNSAGFMRNVTFDGAGR